MVTAHILAVSSLVGVCAVAIAGTLGVRVRAQKSQDRRRRHYIITFPRDIPFESVMAFTRALGGITVPLLARPSGLPTICFEVESSPRGIIYRLSVPLHLDGSITAQIRAHIPGARIAPDEVEEREWDEAVELRMTSNRPLRIGSPEAVIKTLLTAFMPLKDNEAIKMQWVVAPALSERPDVKNKAQQEKHKEPTFLAVGRIAAKADDPARVRQLRRQLFNAVSSMRAWGVSFQPRRIPDGTIKRRLRDKSGSLLFPCELHAGELATIIAWPAGNPSVPGLPQGVTRPLPADTSIPKEGLVLGNANFSGGERAVAITAQDLMTHMQLVGVTGSGKSTAMENIIAQAMANGFGALLIDPNGDSYHKVLNLIPQERIDNGDVCLFDPSDESHSIGLNVLEGSNPYLTADRLFAVFDGLYDIRGRMPRTVDVLQSAVLTLALKNLTLMDLPLLLSTGERGKDFRYEVTRKLDNPSLRFFWQTFDSMKDSERSQWTAPLMHRLSPFTLRPSLRAALGQTESRLSVTEVVRDGKILLANLSKGMIGEETSQLFAALLVSQVWQAMQGRADIPPDDRKPFLVALDEFHNYTRFPVSFETVLAEGRKYGLGMMLVHQDMSQLPPYLRSAVTAHTRSKLVFQTSQETASALARELLPYVEARDITNLGRYEAIYRHVGGPPATVDTLAPLKPLGTARAARTASRERYGRSIAEVERELDQRHRFHREVRQKPSIGVELPSSERGSSRGNDRDSGETA